MKLPVDFEQKVKLPPQVNGVSYPYRISAKDLMDDFKYAALQVDDVEVDGLQLVETIALDGTRTVKLDGEIAFPHPWKCTSNGDDSVTISPGFTLGTTSQDSPGLEILPSFALLKPLDSFVGGTVIVTGTGYIVGYVAFSYGTIVYETEALTSVDAETVPINTVRLSVGNGVNVEFSSDFPDGTTPGNYYFVIAKVSLSGGVAVVDEQYLHYNPTLDIYLADGK